MCYYRLWDRVSLECAIPFRIFPDGGNLKWVRPYRILVGHKNIFWNIWFKPFWCGEYIRAYIWTKQILTKATSAQPISTHRSVLKACWITCNRNTWPRERKGKKEILSWLDQDSMVWEGRWKIQRMCQTILMKRTYKPFGLEDKRRWWYWTFMTNQFYGFWFSDGWPLSLDDVNIYRSTIIYNLLPKYLRLLRSLMPKRLLDCKPRWGRSSRQKHLTGQVSPRVWGGVEITSILVGAQQMIRLYFEDIVGSCRLRPCLIGIQQSHKPCMRLTMSIKSNSCTVVRKTFAVSLPPLACVD